MTEHILDTFGHIVNIYRKELLFNGQNGQKKGGLFLFFRICYNLCNERAGAEHIQTEEGGDRVREFDAIYRENADIVYRYLFSLTHDAHLAEELTQQTFYEAVRNAGKYRGESALSTYLCGIAKNLMRRELARRRKRGEVPLDQAAELPAPEDTEAAALEKAARAELFRRIHSLPTLSREVVYLRLAGELSFAEIGGILGRSENWARVTFYRAKLLLKGDEQ